MTPQVSAQLPLILQKWLFLPCLQVISWLTLSKLCGAVRKHELCGLLFRQLFITIFFVLPAILNAGCLSMFWTRNENSGKKSGQRVLNSDESWGIKIWSKKIVKIKKRVDSGGNSTNMFCSCSCFLFFCWSKEEDTFNLTLKPLVLYAEGASWGCFALF